MFLLIDIGNTRTKWMLRDKDRIYKHDSFLTEDIDQDHFEFDVAIKKILISNVAGFEKEAILKIKLKKFLCPVEFIKAHKKLNHLINNYQDATKLGTDRWLSALSVSHDISRRLQSLSQLGLL
jgi:type III pantothenate kinase